MKWEQVKIALKRPMRYWLFALFSIAIGMLLGVWLDEKMVWIKPRYRLYQGFEWLVPHQLTPKWTTLVLVDDDQYWKKRPSHRTPIRRDYLADLVHAVDACNPSVIALDFDLRSPVTDGTLNENPIYMDETRAFIRTVFDVSNHCPTILPATLDMDSKENYTIDSAVYNIAPLPENLDLRVGYIQLPTDARQIPTAISLQGKGKIDSFATAIVGAVNEDLVRNLHADESLPFGTFIKEDKFRQVLAADVISGDGSACNKIRHRITIIGASWHKDSFNKGPYADTHDSPLGPMRGVFMHANYVEAVLDSRTYAPLGERGSLVIDFLFSGFVALVLSLRLNWRKFLLVGAVCLLVMLTSYFFWQNLGVFFDFFFPALFLTIHAFVDYFRDIQSEVRACRRSALSEGRT